MNDESVSSKDTQEGRQILSGPEGVIEFEYQNAKERLVTQRETIKSLSEEGARYLRLLLILIGVPVTVLGVFEPTTLSQITTSVISDGCFADLSGFCIPMKFATGVGSFSLLLALMMNITAGGFEAHGTRNITNPEDINKSISSERSYSEHLSVRIQDYEERIRHNDKVIFTLDSVLGAGKSFLLISILAIGLLSYRLVIGSPLSAAFLTSMLLIIGVFFFMIQYILPNEFTEVEGLLEFKTLYSQNNKQGSFIREEQKSKNSQEDTNQPDE